MPVVSAAVSFSTGPTATPSYVDVSPYLRSFATDRGRQFELDRMKSGTAQVLFNNQDRRFDFYNTASPYSPNVLPRKRLRLQATWNSITYPIYVGYIEKWPQTWQLSGLLAEVQVTASDGFALFGQAALNATYPAELSSTRVGRVLDSVGWGTGADRDIRTGFANLQASVLTSTTALEHLLSVGASENGYIFMSSSGALTFLGRNYGTIAVSATFGDGPGELKYSDLALDTAPIVNDVRLSATGRAEQLVSDATSRAAYFLSSKIDSQYLQAQDNDLYALADWYLFKYKQPQNRVTSMTVMPSRDPNNLWPQVLGREIGDHIIVKRRPPGGGAVISQESVIEGIQHSAQNSQWATQFLLSPAEPTNTFAKVGTAIVGTSTVGY